MSMAPMTGITDDSRTQESGPVPLVRGGWTAFMFSGALAAAVGLSAGFTVGFPAVLHGAAVSNGNVRGTAVTLLAVGLPVLFVSVLLTAHGSARALVVWLGTLGYLVYQAVLLCFATPLNNLFLIYVAYLSLAVWSIVVLLRATGLRAFAHHVSLGLPARTAAAVALMLVALNAGAWLARIVPAVLSSRPTSVLDGSGLLTNPVYVQDLAIWLPLLATAAVACWRRAPWGFLVTVAMLAMFVLESTSIAVDQWFGSHADPSSTVSSLSVVPAFAAIAVVLAGLVAWILRAIDTT
jgi:hypothetical protein